jgi:short-subunit dehydrogenase
MDGQIRERLIAKGNKAINDGQVAIIINAAGQGEDSEFFEKSKIWNKPD